MRVISLLIVLIGCVLAGCAGVTLTGLQNEGAAQETERRLLVTIRQSGGRAQPQLGDPGAFYLTRRGYGPLPQVNRMLEGIADDYDLRRVDGWHISSIGQYCEVYEVREGQSRTELIERMSADPRVELVQPMNYFETQGVRYDDPLAMMQPALSILAIHEAHEMATGRGVTVAVIDSTVDRRHPELLSSVESQVDMVGRRGNTGAEVHGTAVAGVIGSAANNGAGIVGIAPESTIASLRACWTVDAATGRAQCSSFSLAQALESAINLQADVINLSLAGPEDPLLTELIDAAIENDIIVVSAVSAGIRENENFPSSHSAVIAVASSSAPTDAVAENVLRAPGTEVMSTIPNNSYAFFSGSSMSAAYVTGVSALIRERAPGISPADVRSVLTSTGTERTVNACRAIATAAAEAKSC